MLPAIYYHTDKTDASYASLTVVPQGPGVLFQEVAKLRRLFMATATGHGNPHFFVSEDLMDDGFQFGAVARWKTDAFIPVRHEAYFVNLPGFHVVKRQGDQEDGLYVFDETSSLFNGQCRFLRLHNGTVGWQVAAWNSAKDEFELSRPCMSRAEAFLAMFPEYEYYRSMESEE